MKIVSLNINSFGGDGESFEEMKKNLSRKDYGGNLTKECKYQRGEFALLFLLLWNLVSSV